MRCRCGNTNCLEALAGGAAIARDGTSAAKRGASPRLAEVVESGSPITAEDVAVAAGFGDPTSVALLARSARLLGEQLAGLVNFFNPSIIIVGGGLANSGDAYLANVRQEIIGRSLPLATRSLQVVQSHLGVSSGLVGAAFLVIDELFSRELVAIWIDSHPGTIISMEPLDITLSDGKSALRT